MPAALAMATRWSVWLVDPPVACRPTTPLTIAFSSMMRPIGVKALPEGESKRADLHRTCKAGDKEIEADVRLYLVPSEVFGEVLVTVNQDGSFLTLYKRCP